MRWLNLAFLLAYLASAMVQLNDPDPARWVAVYLLAAGTCGAWERRLFHRAVPLVLGVVCGVWGAWILASIPEGVPVTQALGDWGMQTGGTEEVRELGGLGFIVLWMVVLGWRGPRT